MVNIVCLVTVYLTVFRPVGRPYNHQFFKLNLVKILIAQINFQNFFSHGIKILGKGISEKALKAAEIPPYLRFDLVKLNYMKMTSYEGTIGERFE